MQATSRSSKARLLQSVLQKKLSIRIVLGEYLVYENFCVLNFLILRYQAHNLD